MVIIIMESKASAFFITSKNRLFSYVINIFLFSFSFSLFLTRLLLFTGFLVEFITCITKISIGTHASVCRNAFHLWDVQWKHHTWCGGLPSTPSATRPIANYRVFTDVNNAYNAENLVSQVVGFDAHKKQETLHKVETARYRHCDKGSTRKAAVPSISLAVLSYMGTVLQAYIKEM